MGLVGSIAAEPPLPQKTAPKRQHNKKAAPKLLARPLCFPLMLKHLAFQL